MVTNEGGGEVRIHRRDEEIRDTETVKPGSTEQVVNPVAVAESQHRSRYMSTLFWREDSGKQWRLTVTTVDVV